MSSITPQPHALTRAQRIRSRKDFLYIQRKGKRSHGRFITIISQNYHSLTTSKVGFTVSKTVGKAHERNLVKRRLRHIYREHQQQVPSARLVIVALPKARDAQFSDLLHDFLQTVAKMQQTPSIPFGNNKNFYQKRVHDA